MKYVVNSNDKLINWNAKGTERILQNINNVLNTIKYEVPYDRLMGRNPENLDGVLAKKKNILIEETYDLINTYEPRAKVNSVEIKEGDNLEIKVVVSID